MTGRRWSWTDCLSTRWAGLLTVTATAKPAITVLGDDELNIPSGPEARGWLFCPDGGARLLVENDELEGAVVVAVLISPEWRVIAQRRSVVGGEA